jgi:Arc/MetJ-type ribon-helix-helix transcriptional regulator
MKHVISVSVDEDTIFKIRDILRNSNFRNKSHVVEEAVRRMSDGSE